MWDAGKLETGQRQEQLTYDYSVNEAEKRGLTKMVKKLKEKVGSPPHSCKALIQQRNCLAELDPPGHNIWDMMKVFKVLEFFAGAMWSKVTKINLIETVPELKMPTFFLLAREDHVVFPEISTK